jgi:hypothetical protein
VKKRVSFSLNGERSDGGERAGREKGGKRRTPSTLDTELNEESAGSESSERGRQVPQWDEAARPHTHRDDGEATAQELRKVTSDGSTGDSLQRKRTVSFGARRC